jgi:hypothetical protein
MELGRQGRSGDGRSGKLTAAGIIFSFTLVSVYSQNLVQNSNFEAGGGSFADWTISHLNADTNYASYSPMIATSGYDDPYYARFLWEENGGGDILSQYVPTILGYLYDVSFWAEDGAGHNFETYFDFGGFADNLNNAFAIGPGEWFDGWTNFTFSLTAAEFETDLSFLIYADTDSEFGADDISVVAVPRLEATADGNTFQVTVTNCSSSVVIQASTNLVDWVCVCTNTAPCTFTDCCSGFPRRFYRAAVLVQP